MVESWEVGLGEEEDNWGRPKRRAGLTHMPTAFRARVVLAGAAFMAGWMYRQAFPKDRVPEMRKPVLEADGW